MFASCLNAREKSKDKKVSHDGRFVGEVRPEDKSPDAFTIAAQHYEQLSSIATARMVHLSFNRLPLYDRFNL
jgi:hypothetical protein